VHAEVKNGWNVKQYACCTKRSIDVECRVVFLGCRRRRQLGSRQVRRSKNKFSVVYLIHVFADCLT